MASLDILSSNPLNLKTQITKIEHKKIVCGPSKYLKNIPWPINICLKYFMTPIKTLPPPPPPIPLPPTYLMYTVSYIVLNQSNYQELKNPGNFLTAI